MRYPQQLTAAEIEAAVRILFEEGCFYNWWPIATTSYDEFAASDPIAVSELSDIVRRMLTAAAEARSRAMPPRWDLRRPE
jgi:hypothetical protein